MIWYSAGKSMDLGYSLCSVVCCSGTRKRSEEQKQCQRCGVNGNYKNGMQDGEWARETWMPMATLRAQLDMMVLT